MTDRPAKQSLGALLRELRDLLDDLPTQSNQARLVRSGTNHYIQIGRKNLASITEERFARFVHKSTTSMGYLVRELDELRGAYTRNTALLRRHQKSRSIILDELLGAHHAGLATKQGQARVRRALDEAQDSLRTDEEL